MFHEDQQASAREFDTKEGWETKNPILPKGQFGIEVPNNLIKIGDGENNWSNLPFLIHKSHVIKFDEFHSYKNKSTLDWESQEFEVSGETNRQWISQFFITTRCNVKATLTSRSNGSSQVFEIKPSDKLQNFNLNLRGDMFVLNLKSEDDEVDLSDVSVVVTTGRGI